MKTRRWLIALLLSVLAVVVVPLTVSLGPLRGAAVRAFERQWGRPVEVGRVQAQFLPEPGLRSYRVKVSDLEAFGAEPFLQAQEVYCRLKLGSLIRGRLECTRLHLVRPSLNLVRNAQGAWNLALWAQRAALSWPVVSAEEARINFKQGAEKKIYALAHARFSLETTPEAWRLSLDAQPFRSDRRLAEIGRVKLSGTLARRLDATGSLPADVTWEVERAALSQWFAFATGGELAFRADVTLRGRLAGHWRDALLTGEFTLEDLHRWDLAPGRAPPRWLGQFELKFSGSTRRFEIVRAEVRSEHSAVEVRGSIEDLFGMASWDVEVTAPALELDELLAQYGALKGQVAPAARLEGHARLNAKLAGPASRWKAALTVEKAARLSVPGMREPIRVEPVAVYWRQGRVEGGPLQLVFPGARVLKLTGRVVPRESAWFARIEAHAEEAELEHLVAAARALGWSLWGQTQWRGAARVALQWRGDLRRWGDLRRSGSIELRQASFRPLALNQPLRVESARVEYAGRAVRVTSLTVRIGEATLAGALERPRPESPWSVDLRIDRLTLDGIDVLVNPDRARGLFRTLMGSPTATTAAWDQLQARGHLEVEALRAGPFPLSQLRTDFEWKQRGLSLTGLRFRSFGGQFRGSLQGDFRTNLPAYRLAGNLKQIDLAQLLLVGTDVGEFFSGTVGCDVLLQAVGRGPLELRRSLQGTVIGVVTDATLRHINLLAVMRAAAGMLPEETDAQPGTALQSLAGEFRLANRRVRLEGARMVVDTAALEMGGEVDFDGRLNLRVRGEPLLVADIEPPLARRQLFTSSFEIRGQLREPVVRAAAASR